VISGAAMLENNVISAIVAPRNFQRPSAKPMQVPSSAEIAVTIRAIVSELISALVRSLMPNRSWYQCSVKPCQV
jgi:hypothetical protein